MATARDAIEALALSRRAEVERKLAAVLFVDLVASEALPATDPEVTRRQMTRFFDAASGIVAAHGGTVETFAGDAVMAAFGIPRAHEDDAERALRAAFEIRGAVAALARECRIGIEAGEVVSDSTGSTFVTGQAVNAAARLQQLAGPGEVLVGACAHGLAAHAVEFEAAGVHELRGFSEPVPVWRAVVMLEQSRRHAVSPAARLIGRESELALLRNAFDRTVRDRRPQLVTIFGEAGVGKSRLARNFSGALEDARVLVGRSLPYGEGVTYWPVAEMVKASAGIVDDDPSPTARAKLLALCNDEGVADLLALAAGLVEDRDADHSRQEIAWAAREWAEVLAREGPLVLGFEDVHWAEEALLELIEDLACRLRESQVLILCLARPELFEAYPRWGGGRVRGATVELGPLASRDAEELAATLLAEEALPAELAGQVLEKTEGNPLFVEQTVRMLAEDSEGRVSIPDTVQAMIAARIDGLPRDAKTVLQRAAVIGRVFWHGAVAEMSGDVEGLDDAFDALILRDFILQESRSSISGERAFRFEHILTAEIAYSGLPKSARAELHAAFAAWLRERGAEELVEIRAYHLDRSATLLAELEGSPPEELARETAEALEAAGMRALAREANRSARKLLVRSVELEPTLGRRYQAARAAWRLDDIPTVAHEMEQVRAEAHEAENRSIEARALIALGSVSAFRDSVTPRSRELTEEALALLEPDDAIGRFDALRQLSTLAYWLGDRAGARRYAEEALEAARKGGRTRLLSWAINGLARSHLHEGDLDRAAELATEARRLADESGAVIPHGQALHILGRVAEQRGELDAAVAFHEEAIALFSEAGSALEHGRNLNDLAEILLKQKKSDRAARVVREAIAILEPLGDRGYLCESQRVLAEALLQQGRVDDAERYALEALDTVGDQDATSLPMTRMTLGMVRAAQGRDDEAESLLREANTRATNLSPVWIHKAAVARLKEFLWTRGRAYELLVGTGPTS